MVLFIVNWYIRSTSKGPAALFEKEDVHLALSLGRSRCRRKPVASEYTISKKQAVPLDLSAYPLSYSLSNPSQQGFTRLLCSVG